jgi:UDP-glucose 4-epimerase
MEVKKNVLITGGAGFVGGRIAKKLSEFTDIIISSRRNLSKKNLFELGATKGIFHSDLLTINTFPQNIDTVIHMAALNEWRCIDYPSEAIKVNIDDTRAILENSIKKGVKNFIFFSTAHIYASPLKGKITETVLPVPLHPYAITHKAAEDYVIAAGIQKKINTVVLRLSNSFGAPVLPDVDRWTLLANDLCKQAVENKKMVLKSNGSQYRDFICLSDVVNVVERLVISGINPLKYSVYNLGSGVSVRVIDMAKMIAKNYFILFQEIIPISTPDGALPTKESRLIFDVKRLISDGFSIKNDVNEEIQNLLLFCLTHFKK